MRKQKRLEGRHTRRQKEGNLLILPAQDLGSHGKEIVSIEGRIVNMHIYITAIFIQLNGKKVNKSACLQLKKQAMWAVIHWLVYPETKRLPAAERLFQSQRLTVGHCVYGL